MRTIIPLLLVMFALGADWPNWRGPQYNGISTETGWSTNWPAAGPRQLWNAEIGTGFASFSVSRGRAYCAGHHDGNDTIWCLDANTGRVLWKHSYPCELVDNLHEGGPAATPTVDGEQVYTLSKAGHLFCFNAASGDVLWTEQMSRVAGVDMPQWGFSSSALIVDDKVIVDVGRTVALNKLTGEVIWRTDTFKPGYGTPAILTHGGERFVVTFNNDGVLVARLTTGRQVAFFFRESSFDTASTTPVIEGDLIFVSSGYRNGCALLKFDGLDLKPVYENRDMCNHMATCLLWQGHLYGFDGNSTPSRLCKFVCMELATGKVKWSERGFGCGTALIADGKLLVLSDSGELAIVNPSPEKLDVVARAAVIEGKCWTSPILANGRIYCRNADGQAVCVELR